MRFTAANASAMAAKSAEARRQAKAAAITAALLPPPAPLPIAPHDANPGHASVRLARVRSQLDLIDKLITNECKADMPDAQKLDRLASAQMRLSEQERILADRPLPGSRRPTSTTPKSQHQVTYAPLPTPSPSPADDGPAPGTSL